MTDSYFAEKRSNRNTARAQQTLAGACVRFIDVLDEIARDDDDLTDTDVRYAIADVLMYHFVWGNPMLRVPLEYQMLSDDGNRRVSDAVSDFCREALPLAAAEGVEMGAARYALLESAENTVDGIVGWGKTLFPETPLEEYVYRLAEPE